MRLMTPAEYADAYAYLKQQKTVEEREEIAALIEIRTIPLGADMHRIRALQKWGDTPAMQRARREALDDAASTHHPTRGAAA